MIALRALYFFHYGSVAALMSFFPPYLRGLGFSGEQIGAAWAPAQIAAAPAALLWGAAADKLGDRARALRICTVGAACAMALLPFVRTPLWMGALLAAHALFNAGTVPLLDSITMGAGSGYARVRLFGSIGFVVVAQALGVALAARGNRGADPMVPVAMAALVAGTALAAAVTAFRGGEVIKVSPALAKPLLRDAAALWHGALPALLFVCAVHWVALAPYHLLFGVLVRDRGLGAELIGMGMALGVVAEVAVLFAYPRISARLPLRALLGISFAVTAIRWALVWRASSAAELVLLQLLHGATFGLWWGAAVQAMGRLVPAPLRATGQALFSAVVFGAGNAIGYALSGAGYDHFGGAPALFAIAAAIEVVNTALVAGYSGTPLPQKLGIKPGARLAFIGAPDAFAAALGSLPAGVTLATRAKGPHDVIVFFTKARSELEKKLPALHAALEPAGGLWIAWPKKSSGVATDMTEDVVREVALPRGLVDNKVCAIDETWSGLRLVIRKELR